MVCCLCLEDVKGVINIFAEKGKRFDIARILGKYFWFEPTMEDPISTFICYDCLHKLMEFHQFYLKVQQAHCQYSQQHVPDPDTTMEKEELSSEEKPEKPKKTLDYFWHDNMLSYVDDEGKSKTGGKSIPFENVEIEVCESQQHENETTDTLSRSQEAEDNPESDGNVNDSENCTRLLCPHPNCDRWLKDENNLKTHIRQQHSNENKYKSYVCYICDRFCKNRNSYTNHVRYAHSNKTFTCEECNKTFKKAITLREHMARHTGIKLYKCPFCARTFNSNANMHSHKKKKHPEEWDIWRKTKQESSQKLIKSELDGTNQDSQD